jgi:hypothetical protein
VDGRGARGRLAFAPRLATVRRWAAAARDRARRSRRLSHISVHGQRGCEARAPRDARLAQLRLVRDSQGRSLRVPSGA